MTKSYLIVLVKSTNVDIFYCLEQAKTIQIIVSQEVHIYGWETVCWKWPLENNHNPKVSFYGGYRTELSLTCLVCSKQRGEVRLFQGEWASCLN